MLNPANIENMYLTADSYIPLGSNMPDITMRATLTTETFFPSGATAPERYGINLGFLPTTPRLIADAISLGIDPSDTDGIFFQVCNDGGAVGITGLEIPCKIADSPLYNVNIPNAQLGRISAPFEYRTGTLCRYIRAGLYVPGDNTAQDLALLAGDKVIAITQNAGAVNDGSAHTLSIGYEVLTASVASKKTTTFTPSGGWVGYIIATKAFTLNEGGT